MTFDPIESAIAAIAAGGIVVVSDDENRENEGDLIMAAEHVSPAKMALYVRHASGVICVPSPIRPPWPGISSGPATCSR